ncbi:hypothetical protein COCNU_08G011910 [Cocos nucifera]|uniref:Uncharacterized protein n=1 Tax=Cocos nucifera TaxID=13894 RepID=A0A8K0N6U2_COCNU|nr:hypothetical protein COCNU_08G011910 [Cocos nucifera]
MVSHSTWVRYAAAKFEYSVFLSCKKYNAGQIKERELSDAVWKKIFQGKLTFLHWNKGEEMAPTILGDGGTLVRKLPIPAPTNSTSSCLFSFLTISPRSLHGYFCACF